MTPLEPDFGSRTDFYTFAPESLAEALPDFRIVREVGKGSMGIVYEAVRKTDGLRVALKVLPPSLTLTERALARFLREGELMSRVEHRSIVRVFDLGRKGRLHWFAMEFVDGTPLEARLESGPLPVRQAARIAADVARALHFAHERGVVHRDVKPANLILRADDTVAITDFGLARETGTGSMTESGAIVGTPMYMSPEQVLGDRAAINSRADVYGLGATLYHLLTGRPPFVGPTAQSVLKQVLDDPPIRPSRLRAELPGNLEAILLKAIDKDPARRYGSAAELADDLERFLAGERVHARLPGPAARAWRTMSRRPLLTTLCVIILVLAVGAYELLGQRRLDRLAAELANAERLLAQAAGRVDEQMRPLGPGARHALLYDAIAQASQVIALDSRYPRAWFVRAKAHHQLMDYRAAMSDLVVAERVYGGAPTELLLYRIDTASQLHDREARDQLRADLFLLLDRDPSDHNRCIVARHLLAIASGMPERERRDALDKVARIIAPIEAPDGSARVVAARLLELGGDRDGAIAAMREACRTCSGDLVVHSEAAKMFRRLGLIEEGDAEAERARILDPGFPSTAAGESGARVDVTEIGDFLNELEALIRAANTGDGERR